MGTGAGGAAIDSTGSPSKAAISTLLRAGKPFRPRRACSAAMVDLLHFLPSATHLATSSLRPLAGGADGDAEGVTTGDGDTAAGEAELVATGADPPSPFSQAIG